MVLLTAGLIAGPLTGLVVPDELFGELLFPGVSLAVGLLLFDGGLQLQIRRIRAWRGVIMLDVALHDDSAIDALGSIGATVGVGVGAGFLGGLITVVLLRMPQMTQLLRAPVALAVAVAAFTIANVVVPEAGLFATTIVGILLANQSWTPIEDVAAFEEGVGVLALGGLFVILGALIPLDALADSVVPGLLLLAILIEVRQHDPTSVIARIPRTKAPNRGPLRRVLCTPGGGLFVRVTLRALRSLWDPRDVPFLPQLSMSGSHVMSATYRRT